MDEYILLLLIIGLAATTMAWMPAITKHTGISYSIVFVVAGLILYFFLGKYLPSPLPTFQTAKTERLTELIVIISLMGTGIRIDRSFSIKNWSTPLKLISFAMLLCIGACTLLGYNLLNYNLAVAVLLGAVLAPTDPVLASDVQVGPPNEKLRSDTKFSLTAEAGLNDGVAFPFTWLAITLAINAEGSSSSLLSWFAYDFIYKIAAGVGMGYLLGRAAGYMVFTLPKKFTFLKTRDGFLALALTLLVYAITETIHGYGFIAVFIAAISLRHYEKGHEYHDDLHSFTEQAERLLIAIVLILFGGALMNGILDALTWKLALFSVIFLFLIRPVAAFLTLQSAKMHIKEKLAISFFGIRGIGSIYYLAFAFQHYEFPHQRELWAVVSFTILLSILVHGLSAGPIMAHLKERLPKKQIPE